MWVVRPTKVAHLAFIHDLLRSGFYTSLAFDCNSTLSVMTWTIVDDENIPVKIVLRNDIRELSL